MGRLYKQYKENKETMTYQGLRIEALEARVKTLEQQNLDLNFILELTQQELCEKKESLRRALDYSGAL